MGETADPPWVGDLFVVAFMKGEDRRSSAKLHAPPPVETLCFHTAAIIRKPATETASGSTIAF
jgi:hypothetical protein